MTFNCAPGDSCLSRTARYGLPIVLLLASFGLQIGSEPRGLNNIYDEGLITFAAARVLEGDVPYRDFWGMYGPGQFYAVAALFKLFGPSILVERLWEAAIRAGIATMAFLWARRLGAGPFALAAWLATTLLLAGTGAHGFPIFAALLFALISAYLFLSALQSARQTLLFASGASAALAALFRHDMGFYVTLAEALTLASYCLAVDVRAGGYAARIAQMSRAAIPFGLGLLTIAGPVVVLLLIAVPPKDLWFNLFLVPAKIYPKVRSLPFPTVPDMVVAGRTSLAAFAESFAIYFPLAVGAAALALWIAPTRPAQPEGASDGWRRLGTLLLTLVTLLLYLKGIVRVSSLHFLQSIIPAIILLFVLLATAWRRPLAVRVPALALSAVAAFILVAVPARAAINGLLGNASLVRATMREHGLGPRRALLKICEPQPGLERARCYQPRPEDIAMIRLLHERTRPGEPIYVGVAGHDRIFVNNILLHFLAARRSATKWHESHPGIQTNAAVQAQMIEEFNASGVRYLILSAEWNDVREPNASAGSSGVTLLDDYIQANFDKIETAGRVTVWRRRGDAS